MRRILSFVLTLVLLAIGAVPAVQTSQSPATKTSTPITVSAAVSLTESLEEAGKAYMSTGRGTVRFNFAGSNALARQIVNGAPADLFISADEEQMNVVEKAGKIAPGSRVDLLGNQLAIVALPERVTLVREQFARAAPEIRRLAIGDPAAVPAGVYARQYLEKVGAWKAYEPRIIPTTNVRAALTAVETGGADAAIVYVSDAAVARTALVAFVVPENQSPKIVYPAAIVSSTKLHGEAAQFLAFLRGPEASAIFKRHKFTPLTPGR
jgi:molybdate transport system substrate-binding protein